MPRAHTPVAVLLTTLLALSAGCETADSQSRAASSETQPEQTRERLTQEDDTAAPTCIETMQEVAATLAPFQRSAALPGFASDTDALVEMPARAGRPLLAPVSNGDKIAHRVFLELQDDGHVRFADTEATVPIAEVRAEFRNVRRRQNKKAQLLGGSDTVAFTPVLIIASNADTKAYSELLRQVAAIDPTTRVGFVYAEPVGAKMPDTLPPLTIETQRDIRAQHRRVVESYRSRGSGAKELDEATRTFANDVYGKPWNSACHRTWMLIQNDALDGATSEVIADDERACCADVNWDAVRFLAVPGDHRRSYARWHIIDVTLRTQMQGPMGKIAADQPELTIAPGSSYSALLEQIAGLQDVPHQLVIQKP
jgi:hypothetical protein